MIMALEIPCMGSPGNTPALVRTLHYVQERRCPSGGYCYYRLDEPNAGDTWYALHILSLLGEKVKDGETARFLQGLQEPDGSYASYSAALYAGRALRILEEMPIYNATRFLTRSIPSLNTTTQVIETISLFDPLLAWVSLFDLFQVSLPEDWKNQVVDSVLRFREDSSGFGSHGATLQETWQASEILLMLGYPRDDLEINRFVWSCEDPEYGFLGRPGSRPPYLEHLYAGIRLSALLRKYPFYAGACRGFIGRCTHHSGGFVRSVFGGSPTLEFTALAVEALSLLAGEHHDAGGSCG
jgi:hypothetical protein